MAPLEIRMGAFGKSNGTVREVCALADELEPPMLNFLSNHGFKNYEVSSGDVSDMAQQAICETLRSAGINQGDVDLVFFITESFWDCDARTSGEGAPHHFRNGFLNKVLLEAGLERAKPYATWGAACGSLMPALDLARSLMCLNKGQNALVVASDRSPPGSSRVSPSGSVLFSDVACSCLLSSDQLPGFRLGDIITVPSRRMLEQGEQASFAAIAESVLAAMRELDLAVQARSGRPLREYGAVVFESFNQVMIDWVAGALGIQKAQSLTPARELFGHAFAADTILSLRQLGMVPGRHGSEFAVVSFSTWIVSAAIFSDCA